MSAPDANGWLRISDVSPPENTRVMYFYPKDKWVGPAHVQIQSSFISPYQHLKPTHWKPEPPFPEDA